MNGKVEKTLSVTTHKADLLLWFLSVPLLPMIFAEFFTTLSADAQMYFKAYYFVLWAVFAVEFSLRLILSKNRIDYLKENWIDVLVVFTPAFRTFKVFRFMRFPIVFLSDRVLRAFGSLGVNFLYYFIFVTVVVLVGADLALFFEQQSPAAEIKTYNDAVWWSVTFLTTAGNNSYVATTGARVVGVALMTIGFAVFSILIATIVSFFMKEHATKLAPDEGGLLEGIKDELGIDEIMERLERIEKKLNE
ncbi:two pore domain potassium channel family protein [Candidatus Azambacteria bacterium]|nr:two pore domain potassium channel family protein [Candidatus Azambacteria bacterium]